MHNTELSNSRIAEVCRGFSLLLHAGLGLGDSARLLQQEKPGSDRDLLEDVASHLDQGLTLWEAMEKAGVFPAWVWGMVRVGERTGRLEEALEGIADYCEESEKSHRQLRNAVAWPALILVLMLVVIGVLLVEVMPVFDAVYASLGTRLTGLSAGMLTLGRLLRGALPVLLALLTFAVLAVLALTCCRSLSSRAAEVWRRRFGDRGIRRKINNARFARALAMALGSGLTLEEGLELGQGLLGEYPGAALRVQRCRELLEQGAELADAMEETKLLSPSSSRMLAVGLRGGNGHRVMEDIARRIMEDARQTLENTAAKAEPAMVLISSVLVGVILLSAMLPLMNIMTAIG